MHSLECKSIRKFFNEIDEVSPEKHLERTRAELVEMLVSAPIR
jgi:hypothetical protein